MVGRGWGAGQPPGSLLGAKPLGDGKMRWMCERAWPEQTGDLLRLWGQGDIWRTPGLRAAEPGVGRQGRRKETLGFQSLRTLGTWSLRDLAARLSQLLAQPEPGLRKEADTMRDCRTVSPVTSENGEDRTLGSGQGILLVQLRTHLFSGLVKTLRA